jgi:hypothetical protein
MGLFGFGKKVEAPLDTFKDYNSALGGQDNMQAQTFNSGYSDPLMDSNSGLKLADLNAPQQDMGFNAQQGATDSFGNPRVQQKVDNYEYKQQSTSQIDTSTSKDMQLILAKLDTIRSEITNINHRLDNIERHQQEAPQKKYPW